MERTPICIADVDGVLTNLFAKANPRVITMTARLGHRMPFAYVTGRSADWLLKHIIPVLFEEQVMFPPMFSAMCAEYGAVLLRRKKDGTWFKQINQDIALPASLRQEIKERVGRIPGVFLDTTKEVMISVEADHKVREANAYLVENALQEAEKILQDVAAQHSGYEYNRTTYACDLGPKGLNKETGAAKVLDLMMEEHIEPSHGYLFGDALSDLKLADPFIERRIPHTMYFVGDSRLISEDHRACYNIMTSTKLYDDGTIEFLERL